MGLTGYKPVLLLMGLTGYKPVLLHMGLTGYKPVLLLMSNKPVLLHWDGLGTFGADAYYFDRDVEVLLDEIEVGFGVLR